MRPTAQRVAEAVHQNAPSAFCFTCLARQQALKEHDLRAVALVLVMRAGLRLARRPCSSCRCVGDVLLAQQAA